MKFLNNLKMKKFRKGQKGFTLIELLVVIAILGVIAAVAVPNILNFIGEGDTQAAQAEQHNLQVAVTAYMYESNVSVLTAEDVGPGNGGSGSFGAYLINALQYDWSVGTDGSVSPDSSGTNPLN